MGKVNLLEGTEGLGQAPIERLAEGHEIGTRQSPCTDKQKKRCQDE